MQCLKINKAAKPHETSIINFSKSLPSSCREIAFNEEIHTPIHHVKSSLISFSGSPTTTTGEMVVGWGGWRWGKNPIYGQAFNVPSSNVKYSVLKEQEKFCLEQKTRLIIILRSRKSQNCPWRTCVLLVEELENNEVGNQWLSSQPDTSG